jgi:peptidoglycan/LPS O-acetylase OafA/YrhL
MSELPEQGRLRKYRPDVQGLRALAIAMVVLWHVGLINIHGGVDVSFVLSGFLIGSMLLREVDKTGKVALGQFWARRMRRLAPGMAIVLITTIVLSWIFASPLRFRGYAIDGLFSTFSALNWRLAEKGTDYFAGDGTQTPYQHFWSLGIEEQFYLVFPLLLIAVAWLSRKIFRNRALIAAMLVAVIGLSFYLSVTLTKSNQPFAYFGSFTRAWELAVGVMLALCACALSRMNQLVAAILSWVGLAGIVVSGMLITDQTPLPGYAIAGPVMGAALVIAGGCANPSFGAEWLLRHKVANFIGNVSYGWYLWHWPLLVLRPSITGRGTLTFEDRLWVLGMSFAFATIMYYTIERPIRAKKQFVLMPRRGLALGGVFTSAAAVALSVALVAPLNIPPASAATMNVANQQVGLASVLQAADLKQLPGNVRPLLADAPNDKANYGCIDQIQDNTFTMRDGCVLGDKSARGTMVILGDSHAWQWGDAFNQIGNDLKMRVVTITKSGCSPGKYTIQNPELNREYSECDSWRQSAITTIKNLHPQVVVVAGRIRQEMTKEGVESTFAALKATGAALVYITDTPRPGVNVPDCVATHLDNVSACNQAVSDTVQFQDKRATERSAAEKYGASVIDVVPYFCTENTCPPVIGGRVAFFDDSHVTATYARALVPLLEPPLKAAVK